MSYKISITVLLTITMALGAAAQVSSHAPTGVGSQPAQAAPAGFASANVAPMQVTDKPVARVNGAVLTDRDLLREMFSIFPYAKQHNGFPKAQEEQIREGALEMIIFEELVYQEARRRQLTIPAAQLNGAEDAFRKQFNTPDQLDQYMQSEMKGSRKLLRQQIERSLLIEKVLKAEVDQKSAVTLAEVRAYYDKNPARFSLPETYNFQSISIMPPAKPTPELIAQNKVRAEEALKQAKTATSAEQFGLLAEKISEDDFRVNMGAHKDVRRDQLPPQIVKVAASMKPGQVSGLIQIENAFTIFRLNGHTPPHKKAFAEVKADLKVELQKNKYEKLRSNLGKQLRSKAKIELV